MEYNRPKIEYNSPTWEHVEEWLAEELLDTYRRLASMHTSAEDTLALKGRASLLSQMLEFKNENAAIMPREEN